MSEKMKLDLRVNRAGVDSAMRSCIVFIAVAALLVGCSSKPTYERPALPVVQARLARLTNLVDLYQYLGGGRIEHTGDVPSPPEDVGSVAPASHAPWSLFRNRGT
jgi:hypothetical protein